MADTLLLDRDVWDLTIDANGNIAVAAAPYAILQDVASACRLFQDELWYGGSAGIPYFQQILGKPQPIQILKAALVKAALAVPGVLAAQVFLSGLSGRAVSGQVQVTTSAGTAVMTL